MVIRVKRWKFIAGALGMTLLTSTGVAVAPAFAQVDATTSEVEIVNPTTTNTTAVVDAQSVYTVTNLPGGGEVLGDFVVGPGKVELVINPGESKTINLSVSNRTGGVKQFNLTAEDTVGSNNTETTVILLGDDRGPYSMKDYISVPARSFLLGHNQKATVPVTISVPADAEPGGLYGSVLIDTVTVEGRPATDRNPTPRSAVVSRIGTLFFITIPGDVKRGGELVDFSTIPIKRWYQSGPITFGVTFKNTGSIHLTPRGELRIYNLFGQEIGTAELDPWFVLPNSIRLREITWEREFLFGRYTAVVSIESGQAEEVSEAAYTFFVLPWKIVLGGLAGLFIFFLLIRKFFRTFEFKRKDN